MAELKKLQTRLYTEVGELVGELGFVMDKQVFRRLIAGGSQTLHLSYILHKADFDVVADVAVRFDDVQDLLLEGGPAVKLADARGLMSFGAELGNIRDRRQQRWPVREHSDIDVAATGVVAIFKNVGVPYLETFSDRRAALEALSGDDMSAWLHMPVHAHRARLALALCVVLKDKPRFEAVLEHKLAFLTARKDGGVSKVREFGQRMRERLTA